MAYQAIDPSTEYGVFQRALRSGKGLDPVVSAVSAPIAQGIVKRVMAPEEARRKQEFAAAKAQGALAGKGAEIAGQGRLQMQQAVGQLGTTAAALSAAELADYFNTKAQFDAELAKSPQDARKFLEANPDFDPGEAALQTVIAGTDSDPGISAAQAAAARQAALTELRQARVAKEFEAMAPRKTLIEAMASDPQMLEALARREQEKEAQAIMAANAERQFREQNAPGYGDLRLGETPQPLGVADRPALTPQGAREAQSMLNQIGFNVGAADGIIGPRTRRGIMMYQQSLGLPVTGILDAVTMDALRMDFASAINPMSAAEQARNFNERVQPVSQQLPPYMRPGV
jgi:hypothetical protein